MWADIYEQAGETPDIDDDTLVGQMLGYWDGTIFRVHEGGLDADDISAAAVEKIQDGLSTFDPATDEVTTDDESRTASKATVAELFETTEITEDYAAAGAAGTPAQVLYLIQQSLHEFAISGTTRTVKKLDGATTAATFTLDDADTPTSTTRAT